VTVARRLAAVETELDATGRVLRWLAEAHAYDTFDHYVEATLTGSGEMPLDRLVRESIAAARARRLPAAQADDAARAEVRSTVVRYFTALRIIEVTAQALEREALVHGAFTGFLLLAIERAERQPDDLLSTSRLRELLIGRVGELHALRDARAIVEQRFLAGQPVLYPSTQLAWDQQFVQTDVIARMAVRQVELEGGEALDGDAPLIPVGRTERFIADLVEPARAKALDLLGDGYGALERLRGWLT
jgi:hypothetical protein